MMHLMRSRVSLLATLACLLLSAAAVAVWIRSVRDQDSFEYNSAGGTEYYFGTQSHVLVLSRFANAREYSLVSPTQFPFHSADAIQRYAGIEFQTVKPGWSYASANYRHEQREIFELLRKTGRTPDALETQPTDDRSANLLDLVICANEEGLVAPWGDRQAWIDSLGFGYLRDNGLLGPHAGVNHRFVVAIPFWLIALIFFLPTQWKIGVMIRRAGQRRAGRCIQCGYDLRETPTRCPECGFASNLIKPR
ncbi:MAG TPA: hypothetical protein VFE47_12420 [Tepidisphaeraceae bacterium]|jgi:hypothetical protein|nr:hypothetical protein [Tepidisphaeraceae bacterium]